MTDTTKLLRDLVRLPSVNPIGRDLPADITLEHRVTGYLEGFFRGLGVNYQRQPVAPQRENIVARWDNPAGARRTLILEAHQDTVPIDGMTIPPFEGNVEGNKLYGRGACDIKGGMTAMLTAFARAVREKPARAAHLVMACTVDEEHTGTGVRELVERGLEGSMAVVAEPTCLNIVHAHKGVSRWHLTVPGRSCHSSAPEQGVNAIYRMGRLLAGIDAFAQKLRQDTSHPLLGPASLSVGRIEGGISVNTVPDWCRIEIDRRLLPGEDPGAVPGHLAEFLQKFPGIDFPFETSPTFVRMAALSPAGSEELIGLLGEQINQVRGSHRVHPVPYGTDAPPIAGRGIPTVVFGPGDIAQAHTKDEWVPLDEIDQAAEILYRLACAMG